ncbi:MAG: helix-turn-helix domain-containing protein [Bacteroidales bacterium]|jgi:ATP-dependent DNA helicase RecG|nr:helix-turn-helix domain-containing protein [Bacteroidales bacterium]
MLTAEEIKAIVSSGEGFNVDFKVKVPQKVKELSMSVCSFANAAGGYIILGADDKNNIYGIDIDNKTRSAIQNTIREITPAVYTEIYKVKLNGLDVWVIEVPSGSNKPYVYSGAIYVREGSNTQKLTSANEMREFFEQSGRIHFDEASCKEFNYPDDIDEETFLKFCQQSSINTNISQEQILRSLQIFDKDGIIKKGGVLFFGKKPENYFYQAITRCVRFKGTTKTLIIDDKTYGGSLLNQYIKASKWLQDKMEVAYIIDDMGPHKEKWELPLPALREALINAICHREYYEKGANIMVEVYDDRVVITNPGGLLPIVAENFGEMSMSRNPLVFGLFTRMQIVEKVGSGIRRMSDMMAEVNLPEPIYKTKGFFSITFKRLEQKVSALSKEENIVALTNTQKAILSKIKQNPNISFNELANELDLSKKTINKAFNYLKENNLITRQGSKRKGFWMVLV